MKLSSISRKTGMLIFHYKFYNFDILPLNCIKDLGVDVDFLSHEKVLMPNTDYYLFLFFFR
jgi:hypothetical protein